MAWNWQRSDWPDFRWDRARLFRAEDRYLAAGGQFVGTVKHLPDREREELVVESMSREALTTSAIEGEVLNRDSVQSSIRRQLGLASDARRVRPSEQGIGELMIDVFRNFRQSISHERLFAWHRMVVKGRSDLASVGAYRTHKEPMQIISGPIHDPHVHFEAPPSERVPAEMTRFLEWFDLCAPGGPSALPSITRAGIAHLYFESIHPFEDGNGRIGRAIAELTLAQGLGQPSLVALAATLLVHRRNYYSELEIASRGNDITRWLAWFAGVTLEAQLRTLNLVEFVLDAFRFMARFAAEISDRQRTVLSRMLREGPEGFRGGLSAGNYSAIAKTSAATSTRDLGDLVDRGALTRTGEKRHTRYALPIQLRPTPPITIDAAGHVLSDGKPVELRPFADSPILPG